MLHHEQGRDKKGEQMSEHKKIPSDKIEAGMAVAYPFRVKIGLNSRFHYPSWSGAVVQKVTPKRTKAVLVKENGERIEVDLKKSSIYELDPDMEHENRCIDMFKTCKTILSDYSCRDWEKDLDALPDNKLEEVYMHLKALNEIIGKENL